MSQPQPPATTGSAILSTAQAVKGDTEKILDLLGPPGSDQPDRIDKILEALALLVDLAQRQGQELAEIRAELGSSPC